MLSEPPQIHVFSGKSCVDKFEIFWGWEKAEA